MKYRNPAIPEGINTTETNPLKEFVFLTSVVIACIIIITTILALLIDSAAEIIPFEFEVAISQDIAKTLNNEHNKVDDYLQGLADQIIPHMNLPEDMKIQVHYVDKDVVNAMATLGGHVLVYRGLLEKLPNENALVMLLGHEIAHIKLRHPVKALGKGVTISLILSAVLGSSSDSVSELINDTSMLTMLSFSRDQEQASDNVGIKVLNSYYGHVQSATDLFQTFKSEHKKAGVNVPQFLSTHPDIESRIEHLNNMAKKQNWIQQGTINSIPEHIFKRIKIAPETVTSFE
ncbi:MAG: M48 family metallopeptidase [Gammaproteobacteria bacterium]|nr:M48 family metallopeptidase [Gammaproteobacteria bacterium]